MAEPDGKRAAHELAFQVHGVRAVISTSDAALLTEVGALLPPGSTPCPPDSAQQSFALLAEAGVGYRVVSPHESDQTCLDREIALSLLNAELHMHVAVHARNRIFIHAGVVAHRGRAIVIPGPSFSGKTTLVAALVRSGATYYSDEFAFLDENGLVHPYPRPLSVRTDGVEDARLLVERLGGRKGDEAVPIGLIAITSYRPGTQWKPQLQSRGQGMLALLSNTLPARDRPAQALAVTRRAVESALVLHGERGDAMEAAAALLAAAEDDPAKLAGSISESNEPAHS